MIKNKTTLFKTDNDVFINPYHIVKMIPTRNMVIIEMIDNKGAFIESDSMEKSIKIIENMYNVLDPCDNIDQR